MSDGGKCYWGKADGGELLLGTGPILNKGQKKDPKRKHLSKVMNKGNPRRARPRWTENKPKGRVLAE